MEHIGDQFLSEDMMNKLGFSDEVKDYVLERQNIYKDEKEQTLTLHLIQWVRLSKETPLKIKLNGRKLTHFYTMGNYRILYAKVKNYDLSYSQLQAGLDTTFVKSFEKHCESMVVIEVGLHKGDVRAYEDFVAIFDDGSKEIYRLFDFIDVHEYEEDDTRQRAIYSKDGNDIEYYLKKKYPV